MLRKFATPDRLEAFGIVIIALGLWRWSPSLGLIFLGIAIIIGAFLHDSVAHDEDGKDSEVDA